MQLYPKESENLFLYKQDPLSANKFLKTVTDSEPKEEKKKAAYDYFMKFVQSLPEVGKFFVQYITSYFHSRIGLPVFVLAV